MNLEWFVEQAQKPDWVESLSLKRTDALDSEIICGLIVRRPHIKNHGLTSHYQVITSKQLDPIKEKIVCIKELMHIYRPNAEEQNATQLAFDNSMRQFFGRSGVTPSLAVMSEYKALWMALGLVCPEHLRQEFLKQYNENPESIDDIARELELGTAHTRLILSDQYVDEIAALIN